MAGLNRPRSMSFLLSSLSSIPNTLEDYNFPPKLACSCVKMSVIVGKEGKGDEYIKKYLAQIFSSTKSAFLPSPP
ncbi:hypothetical protein ANOM_000615 [Aspergillus nomiae NRRL 13137]|uniref:Uncharacterized protein n=1 Tax=Aspergillus nomiae NRRL (strain ATCC 15546 / NRRL 13137 / CBS 260.88 / M93) TaxID=1509407 RepID=A0A0L1JIA8_ASPN3|nr:uncharacterized protein ANOM_000615 [Aspergillus nomiae NRRL 13137]KNG91143.1 hypothetical protein ANOM_000615 [Aspergillus nomiae NRRL 13137]